MGDSILKKTVITLVSALALSSLLVGCGNQQSQSGSNSTNKSSQVTSHKATQQTTIVGSFKDVKDGAAITLNSDGTGQYVYADSDNPDTNDQLTWKKDGNSYTVTLQDSNVSSPLTAKLSGTHLTLSGSGDWNTETFTKSKSKINLNQFLSDAHKSQKTNSNSGNNQASQNNQNNQSDQSSQGNDSSQSGNTKDYTDSQGDHHHIVMANNPGPHDPKGTDYVTDSDGHTHVFEYDGE